MIATRQKINNRRVPPLASPSLEGHMDGRLHVIVTVCIARQNGSDKVPRKKRKMIGRASVTSSKRARSNFFARTVRSKPRALVRPSAVEALSCSVQVQCVTRSWTLLSHRAFRLDHEIVDPTWSWKRRMKLSSKILISVADNLPLLTRYDSALGTK